MPRFSSIAEVMASYPSRFYSDKAKGVDGVIQFVFTGDQGADYHMAIHNQKVDVVEGLHPEPTVTITVPGEAWLDVNIGRVSPTGLRMQGKLKVSGSLAMAAKFQTMFKPGRELT